MSLRKFCRHGALMWLVGAALGCSGSDPATGGGGGAGSSAGVGGSGGTSSAGTGGAAAGSASAGAPASVFNSALPVPSFDCRTDTASKDCVSVSGTAAGMAVDDHCDSPNSPDTLLLSPPAWPSACELQSPHRIFNVNVPVQDPGPFHYMQMPNGPKGPDVLISINDTGGNSASSNFMVSEIAGVVTKDASSGDAIVAGTFRATWTAPNASCDFLGGPCAAGDFNGTFRSDNYKKP